MQLSLKLEGTIGKLATPIAISARKLTRKKIMQDVFTALGRYYEHKRPDRVFYIEIKWKNILPGEIF